MDREASRHDLREHIVSLTRALPCGWYCLFEEEPMSAATLLVVLALGQAQPDKAVTDAEKKEFFEVLAKLPSKGEFYTAEAITKAIPYTRVLLALTEKDLEKYDLYPFVALSRGLIDSKESRQYGITHFQMIAHPTIKLFWAAVLFSEGAASPEIVTFLRKALDSKEDARSLRDMSGPGFEEFREGVIRTYDLGRQTKIELVKQHATNAFLEYDGGLGYTKETYAFAPGQLLYAVRPSKQQGELTVYHLAKGTTARLVIPQPKGFKADSDFARYFDNPVLAVNSGGDLLCRWTIAGNGDHALALLKKGSDAFVVKRVKLYLADCTVAADFDGTWYLIQGGPDFTVYRLDQELNLSRLGNFAGKGHHSIHIEDARFISKDMLHLFWADVLSRNHLRMRCVDFDVKQQKWLHSREIFRLDKFVSSASEPTVLQLKDDSLHYLWRVDEGAERGEATGLYYQAETDGKTVRVANGYQYRAIAVGNRIIVCYTNRDSPEKVFFRIIQHGTLGPASEIEITKGRKDGLGTEYMVLHVENDRIWFVNTHARNTLYELKMVDAK
jgi:hypothetical protein